MAYNPRIILLKSFKSELAAISGVGDDNKHANI
jgi:hypothetical protein